MRGKAAGLVGLSCIRLSAQLLINGTVDTGSDLSADNISKGMTDRSSQSRKEARAFLRRLPQMSMKVVVIEYEC